jgi:hypothetical protein
MSSVLKEIKGILLFNKPNKHTILSPYSPYYSLAYIIYLDAHIRGISPEEDYLVGTRCGTEVYNGTRVKEYTKYRTNTDSIQDIIREKYNCFVNLQIDLKNYKNMLYKEWFGNDLLEFF